MEYRSEDSRISNEQDDGNADDPSKEAPGKNRKYLKFALGIFILLIVCGVGFAASLLAPDVKNFFKLRDDFERHEHALSMLSQKLADRNVRLDEIEASVSIMSEAMERQSTKVEASPMSMIWSLREFLHSIQGGVYRSRDKEIIQLYLKGYVDDLESRGEQHDLLNVYEALRADLRIFSEIEPVVESEVDSSLERIVALITQLSNSNGSLELTVGDDVASDANAVDSTLNVIWQELKTLVSVRRLDGGGTSVAKGGLSEVKLTLLLEQMRSMKQSLRFGSLWELSSKLNAISFLVNEYAIYNPTAYKEIIELIHRLEIAINRPRANFNATFLGIEEYLDGYRREYGKDQ